MKFTGNHFTIEWPYCKFVMVTCANLFCSNEKLLNNYVIEDVNELTWFKYNISGRIVWTNSGLISFDNSCQIKGINS